MRLINADDIFPWYVEAFKGEIEPHDVRFSMHDIEMNLSNIPTIDAVSVIRCKDCKHYADDACDRYADETLGYVHSTQADGFCWVAERKEE